MAFHSLASQIGFMVIGWAPRRMGQTERTTLLTRVLGAFSYCVHQPKNRVATLKVRARFKEMIWHRKEGDGLSAL